MSEYTAGALALLKNKQAILEYDPMYIKDLNDKWFVFITKDSDETEEIPVSLFQISEKIPLLYFYNFEDHCWGYRVIYNSQEIANLHVAYELVDTMIIELAEERYPDEDHIEFLYVDPRGEKIRIELIEEVERSNEYKENLIKQFINCNLETFRLFEIDMETIKQLGNILNVDYYTQLEFMHQLVEEFKEILDIQEMSWIRAD